ncbi:hypothetical protein X915_gp253 [Bacillus phage vB_BanS-Tsamsa]|uniref:Phage protein n=1 Tax=Bacillus phage vB_BanS-Tsamsa TaxID=1308863 RepID=U5JA63_9CAUD|nr:hypothetical protein X915_gp253 [Bacillus phage vB_BanS-Tsamsa]AGI11854.1 hypothetical protein [Bacillus phage vB_BanS-Tsamsa]
MNLELNDFQTKLLKESVKHVEYLKLGQKTTVAFVTAVNGFEITGTSGCVNPTDFNFEIGKHFALVDALNQLEKFQGYYNQQMNHMLEAITQHGFKIPVLDEEDKKNVAKEILKEVKKENRKKGF